MDAGLEAAGGLAGSIATIATTMVTAITNTDTRLADAPLAGLADLLARLRQEPAAVQAVCKQVAIAA